MAGERQVTICGTPETVEYVMFILLAHVGLSVRCSLPHSSFQPSLIPRPLPGSCFDNLQFAKMERAGESYHVTHGTTVPMSFT